MHGQQLFEFGIRLLGTGKFKFHGNAEWFPFACQTRTQESTSCEVLVAAAVQPVIRMDGSDPVGG